MSLFRNCYRLFSSRGGRRRSRKRSKKQAHESMKQKHDAVHRTRQVMVDSYPEYVISMEHKPLVSPAVNEQLVEVSVLSIIQDIACVFIPHSEIMCFVLNCFVICFNIVFNFDVAQYFSYLLFVICYYYLFIGYT